MHERKTASALQGKSDRPGKIGRQEAGSAMQQPFSVAGRNDREDERGSPLDPGAGPPQSEAQVFLAAPLSNVPE